MSLRNILYALLTLAPLALCAEENPPAPKEQFQGPDHLFIGPGIFNVDKHKRRFATQLEYRWDLNCYNVRPLVGLLMNTDQSTYAYGGVSYDIFLGKYFVLTPSFAGGLYAKGRGRNLGFPFNFRSALEIAYIFSDQMRFGAQFSHISNASLGHRNPGVDSLIFFFGIPFANVKKAKS